MTPETLKLMIERTEASRTYKEAMRTAYYTSVISLIWLWFGTTTGQIVIAIVGSLVLQAAGWRYWRLNRHLTELTGETDEPGRW